LIHHIRYLFIISLHCSLPSPFSLKLRYKIRNQYEVTDEKPGIPKTPIVPVQFSGSPSFDSNGVESMVPESPPYTGYPSPEIDEAWEALNGGRYFAITEKEAKELWGKGYMEFADKIHGGFTTGYVHLFDMVW
jgi:hypothetical protein